MARQGVMFKDKLTCREKPNSGTIEIRRKELIGCVPSAIRVTRDADLGTWRGF